MPDDRSARLALLARDRHEETMRRAHTALAAMAGNGEVVTISAFASRAKVSRSWLYTQPALRDQIEQLRLNPGASAPTRHIDSRSSTDSPRSRLELAHQQIRELRTENRQLRDSLAQAHGQLRADKIGS